MQYNKLYNNIKQTTQAKSIVSSVMLFKHLLTAEAFTGIFSIAGLKVMENLFNFPGAGDAALHAAVTECKKEENKWGTGMAVPE